MQSRTSFWLVLLGGDLLVIAGVTLAGFAAHHTLGSAGARLLTTFLPLAAAWGLAGAQVGVFSPLRVREPRQLWRPCWAMILGAPWFALFRAWLLGVDSISATFIVVLGGIAALAMLAWRALFTVGIAPRFGGAYRGNA
jgi:hypothetical protein